jgi:hypothetical protein
MARERLLKVLVPAAAPVEISLRWRPLLRDPAHEPWMARRAGSPWLRNDASGWLTTAAWLTISFTVDPRWA